MNKAKRLFFWFLLIVVVWCEICAIAAIIFCLFNPIMWGFIIPSLLLSILYEIFIYSIIEQLQGGKTE